MSFHVLGKFDFTSCVNVKLLFTHRDPLMFKRTILFISKMQRHEGVLVCVGTAQCILNHGMHCMVVWVSSRVGREGCRWVTCDLLPVIAPQSSRWSVIQTVV